MTEHVIIAPHLNGPADSANGGVACAEVALLLGGEAEVTLKLPPPLGIPIAVCRAKDEVELRNAAGEVVAVGRKMELSLEVPPAISYERASEAATRFAGHLEHAFPTCFSCGPGRDPDEALCIHPGPIVAGQKQPVAANWLVRPHLADPARPSHAHLRYLGGAIDCAGAWATMPDDGHLLLGRMHLALKDAPRIGEHCVVMGWAIGVEGRKHFSGTVAYGEDGRMLAKSRQTWIRVLH